MRARSQHWNVIAGPAAVSRRRVAIIVFLLVWTCLVTVVRGLHLPNDFAEAHWLLDYRFGFVKRGLIGTILSGVAATFGLTVTAQLILVLSSIAFATFCCVMLVVSVRLVRAQQWSLQSTVTALVFLSSPFIVMSANLIGYYDHLIVILGVISIAVLRRHPWIAAVLQLLCVLIHESTILLVAPAYALAWLLLNRERREQGLSGLPILSLLAPAGGFVIVAASSALLPPDFAPRFEARLEDFPFIGAERRGQVPVWLATSFEGWLRVQEGRFMNQLLRPGELAVNAPSILVFALAAVASARLRILSAGTVVLVAICCVPLVMHAVAWDIPRIWTYPVLCSFLALWVFVSYLPTRPPGVAVTLLAIGALLGNIAFETALMNGLDGRLSLGVRVLCYLPPVLLLGVLAMPTDRAGLRAMLEPFGVRS